MDDQELIEAARNGEEHAGPFLVSLHGPAMVGYCRAIAADLSDADREHIIENAIERAVRRIETYDPARASFRTWLRTFVLHAAQDWRRSNAKISAFDLDNHPEIRSEANAEPDDGAQARKGRLGFSQGDVRQALANLSVADQLIIALRDMEGRSVDQAAATLRITAAACRQRHHRARQRLKSKLILDPRIAALTGENTP